jgi:hypothetical protein
VGFRDFFTSEGRSKSRIARHVKTVTNPYTQSGDRYGAMEGLLADGSEDAWVGLLKRFTISSIKSIEDEEEKGWAYRKLASLGKPLLPALRRFCLEHDQIAWALRILEDVANADEEWEFLEALLANHPPGYERDPSKKIQLLTHLQEIDDERIVPILAGYLADADESVRYFAADALVNIGEAPARQPLLDHLLSGKEDSLRLRVRILDGFAQHGWDVTEHVKALASMLGNEHLLRDGRVIKR